MSLRLDWCSHAAAKYACENWHYSACVPKSKLVKVGVWEEGVFVGCVIFSYGATPQIGSPYGLSQYQICELTRVALNAHTAPTSQVLNRAIRMLRKQSPGLRLIVSFADTEQGHIGTLYQASNWVYAGTTKQGRVGFVIHGKKTHTRTIGSMKGGVQSLAWVRSNLDPAAVVWEGRPKHRYLYPLDDEMRRQIEPLRKPYPKRPKQATPSDQEDSGGAAPTRTLQS